MQDTCNPQKRRTNEKRMPNDGVTARLKKKIQERGSAL